MRKDSEKTEQKKEREETEQVKNLAKVENNLPVADGFDGYEDRVEGDDQPERTSVIQGTLLRFTNDFAWMTNEDDELSSTLELFFIDVLRVVPKWGPDGKPAGPPIVVEPGQRFPDVDKMNAEAPRDEWIEQFGKMVGPYQRQHVCYLLDTATMTKYTFPTSTVGGSIAVRELVDKVKWMRKFRGAHVCPVVTLATKHMKTDYGRRERPHFIIKRWVDLGGDGGDLLPVPTTPTNGGAGTAEKPVEDKKAGLGTVDLAKSIGKPVTPPTHAENMNDDLPF
jgi:hypothetical protein